MDDKTAALVDNLGWIHLSNIYFDTFYFHVFKIFWERVFVSIFGVVGNASSAQVHKSTAVQSFHEDIVLPKATRMNYETV